MFKPSQRVRKGMANVAEHTVYKDFKHDLIHKHFHLCQVR